jgi:hypothetical protein
MPEWNGEIRRRLSAVRLPAEREAAIVDEVAQHLEDRYQTLLASGQPAAEAERDAWRELEGDDVLGRLLSAREPPQRPSLADLEAAPRGRLVRGLWHDVRYAVRNLRKRSMLSATIIVTLAISLGPTAAVIGMADALFFRPLPVVAGQDRLLHYAFGTPTRDGLIPHVMPTSRKSGTPRQLSLGSRGRHRSRVAWRWTVSRLVSPSARRPPPTTSTCSACA